MATSPWLWLSTLALASTPVSVAQLKLAAFELRVVDSFGGKAEPWELALFRDQTGREWKAAFKPDGTAMLPPGEYSLRIESFAFLPFEATVRVNAPSSIYVAGLIFAGIDNIPPSDDLRGRFESGPGANAWCKISGVYTQSTYFTAVQQNGTFVFPYVPVGTYVLVCRLGDVTLDSRVVEHKMQATPEIVIGRKR